MFIDCVRKVQYSRPPLGFKERLHALEYACGLINSISGGKTRLHPPHVVRENSSPTCRRVACKPLLGRTLLETCDRECVVVPEVLEHCAGFYSVLFAPTGNAPWPQIPWWMWNPKSSLAGVSNLSPGSSLRSSPNILKVVKIHHTITLESLLMTSIQTFLNLEHRPEKISHKEFASGPWHLGAVQIRAR